LCGRAMRTGLRGPGERCPPRQELPATVRSRKTLRSVSPSQVCEPGGWQSKSRGFEAEITRAAVACLHLHYVSDNTGPPNAFNSTMNLSTSRLILRPWRDTDLDEFARLNADPVVMEFCRGAQPAAAIP